MMMTDKLRYILRLTLKSIAFRTLAKIILTGKMQLTYIDIYE